MRMKRLGILLALATITMPGASDLLQAAQTCDRHCLVALMQNYLAAPVNE